MQPSQWEIVVLKPTQVFLSFLAAQLPDVELPDIRLLQADKTAYVIRKCASDEETLDEIERHFASMFRHEICRWLGEDARNHIEGSFLDFLCCFKFELHSQMVLMEPSLAEGNSMIRIKPRSVLLKWMRTTVEDQVEISAVLDKIDVSHLAENATVVVKNFKDLSEIKPFLQENFMPIFETEMSRMAYDLEQWPQVECWEDFSRYFSVEIHTELVHLSH